MTRSCPICQFDESLTIDPDYMGYALYECRQCGHRFVDSEALSQAWLDDYYLNTYKTDDLPYSDARLNSLAQCVKNYSMFVLDIGGMDGELQDRLTKIGVTCDVSGVGDNWSGSYASVILSHTLEHIYDVPAMFARIKANLVKGGYLFIEVPIHSPWYLPPKVYDYHWQHIQKFRVVGLVELMLKNGFEIVESVVLPMYREYHCHRMVARYA
jgi:hypothetical protein